MSYMKNTINAYGKTENIIKERISGYEFHSLSTYTPYCYEECYKFIYGDRTAFLTANSEGLYGIVTTIWFSHLSYIEAIEAIEKYLLNGY